MRVTSALLLAVPVALLAAAAGCDSSGTPAPTGGGPGVEEPDREALRTALTSDDLEARADAAVTIALLGERGAWAVPDLVACLEDLPADDPAAAADVRKKVVGALGKIGAAAWDGMPGVLAAMTDADDKVRAAAAYAAGEIAAEAGTKDLGPVKAALVAAAEDDEWFVRAKALRSLGLMRAGDAAPVLLAHLDEKVDRARQAAAQGFMWLAADVPDAMRPEVTRQVLAALETAKGFEQGQLRLGLAKMLPAMDDATLAAAWPAAMDAVRAGDPATVANIATAVSKRSASLAPAMRDAAVEAFAELEPRAKGSLARTVKDVLVRLRGGS